LETTGKKERHKVVNILKNILALLSPPDFDDEERNRVAGILHVMAMSILTGYIILFFIHALFGQIQLSVEIIAAGVLIAFSIFFLRIGKLLLAENLLLCTFLGSIVYILFSSRGVHSIALLAIPLCLVFAGLALKKRGFLAFGVLTVISIVVIGMMEISGQLVNRLSYLTTFLDVIDISIILIVTAFTVRILAVHIVRNMHTLIQSEREVREQADVLKESEEKFRTLTEELPNMVFILKRGKIVYSNEKCEETIGYLRNEMSDPEFDVLSIVAPEYRDSFVQKNKQLMDGEDVGAYECAFLSKGDDYIYCLQMSKVIHYGGEPAILSLVTDLTEIKRAQEEVQENQMRLASVITSAMEAIITLDEKKHICSFNPAASQMFGCPEYEAIGQMIDRFISFPPLIGEQRDASGVDLRSFIKELDGKVQLISGIRVNGETFPAEISLSQTRVNHEFVYTIILRDIADRLKSEERQRDLQAQLLQSQKMEAVGALAGGIAHDFNNFLSVIIGNSELVKLKLGEGHPAEKNIDEVLSGSERAHELIHQILAFSRKQDTKLRPLRLHYVLREGMKLLRASIPSTVDIKIDLPANGPFVLGDPTQLHQVLMNLCINAVHAMQGMNGKLVIRQKNVVLDDRAFLSSPDLREGEYALFIIQDNGCGMDGFTLKRVFEPFFTTKTPGKGTGLGLSIVHSIVKSHGGAVKIKSELGKGTQIEIYLPVIDAEDDPLQESQIKEKRGEAEKIMIVDDEQSLLCTLEEILKGLGYTPIPFNSSLEALQAFEQDPLRYDLVITDQTMPSMTGTLLAHRICLIRGDVPIILMTGYDQLEDPEKLKKLGIRTVILKPFKKTFLGDTIKNVLEQKEKV
jgi:PAS domain S-box-containing protein